MSTLDSVTTNVLAILIIVGGGFMLAAFPEMKDAVLGLFGVVIGYYFRRPSPNQQETIINPPIIQQELQNMTPALFVIVGALLIYLALSGKLARVIAALSR